MILNLRNVEIFFFFFLFFLYFDYYLNPKFHFLLIIDHAYNLALASSLSSKEKQKLKVTRENKGEMSQALDGNKIDWIKLIQDYFILTDKWDDLSSQERHALNSDRTFPWKVFDVFNDIFEFIISQLESRNKKLINDNNNYNERNIRLLQQQQLMNIKKIEDIKKFRDISRTIFKSVSIKNFIKFITQTWNAGFNSANMFALHNTFYVKLIQLESIDNKNKLDNLERKYNDLKKSNEKQVSNSNYNNYNNINNKKPSKTKINNSSSKKPNDNKGKNFFRTEESYKNFEKLRAGLRSDTHPSGVDIPKARELKLTAGFIRDTDTFKTIGFCDPWNISEPCYRDTECWWLHECSFCGSPSHGRNMCPKLRGNNNNKNNNKYIKREKRGK